MQYSCGIIYLLFSSEVHFMDKKIAVLTGGTSGIGMQTALALKNAGYTVYELSRRAQGVEGLNHLVADVTDEAAVKKAVDEIVAREGKIDVLVNNAGFGISGAVEFTKTEDAKRLFDTNFFGMVNMNRAVVPVMREAGQGRIVNISSVAGQIPIPFQTYYSAAKAATNSYTMALANELRPYGVTVCAVQPGDIKRALQRRAKRRSTATMSTADASGALSPAWSMTSRPAWIPRSPENLSPMSP